MQKRHNNLNQIAAFALTVTDSLNEAMAEQFDRSHSEIETLISVRYCNDFTVGWLSDVLDLTHSAAVRIVDRLEKDNRIRRIPQTNRRYVGLVLTPSGVKLADDMLKARQTALEKLFEGIEDNALNRLMTVTRKILESGVSDKLSAYRRCRSCDENMCGSSCPVQRASQ